jgi:hypothetical protein
MDKVLFFERNLLALSKYDPVLCSRLSGAETTRGRYKFIESRSGELIPAWVDSSGAAHPLHSLVDPRREGKRLISLVGNKGFLILFGLGGAFHAEAALEHSEIEQVLVVDYDIHSVAELLSSREYIALFNDPRFHLLVDPAPETLEQYILELYKPALYEGIQVLPLRTRTDLFPARFNEAGEAVKKALDAITSDYSVQAYFGKRWFSNIIRNMGPAEEEAAPLPPIRHAAICAAGPSLTVQLSLLMDKRKDLFLIAADTALPALLSAGLEPDAVVSIDCQHISYYHFMAGIPKQTTLFLDLASPPLLTDQGAKIRFFSGGHPLTRYISRYWRPFPEVDTSGANVSYAALSLAELLGARTVELYGVDFSYPQGITYAKGTYIYPFFEKSQNRLHPLEALHSSFLYRSPLSKHRSAGNSWYYETKPLGMYRQRLEEKARLLIAEMSAVPGLGAPLVLEQNRTSTRSSGAPALPHIFVSGRTAMEGKKFLFLYREKIGALPVLTGGVQAYLEKLNGDERLVFTTLLPAAAALKRRQPELRSRALMEAVRNFCISALDQVL